MKRSHLSQLLWLAALRATMRSKAMLVPIFVAAMAALALDYLHAQEVAWGDSVNGLRIGITSFNLSTPANQPPVFTVILKNTSNHRLTIPAASAYIEHSHPRVTGWRTQPLHPLIEKVKGAEATYSLSGGESLKTMGTELLMLQAGESLTLPDLPLVENSFCARRDDYNGRTTRLTWWLLPESTYRVRFSYDNEQTDVAGRKVWVGKAASGTLTIRVTSPALDDFNLAGTFSLATPKDEYFVGEPLYVIFEVTNNGNTPFEFPVSGFGVTGRRMRFSFTAIDENGETVPDPIKEPQMCSMGGIGSRAIVKPGETYSERRVLVNAWCAFTKPGRYTITCKRRLSLSTNLGIFIGLEAIQPTLTIEKKLTVTLRRDDEALAKHVKLLHAALLDNEGLWAYEQMSALALMQSEVVFPIIERLARTQGRLQEYAFQWLSYFDKEKAAPILIDIAKSYDLKARMEALSILARWKVTGVGALVQDALRSPDASERAAAIHLCWLWKYAECLPILLVMADDKDREVRKRLGAALGVYGDRRAVPILLKLLRDSDPDHLIKLWAASSLGKLGRKDGIPVLIDLLQRAETRGYHGNIFAVLEELTGMKLREDPAEWRAWWQRKGKAKYGEPR